MLTKAAVTKYLTAHISRVPSKFRIKAGFSKLVFRTQFLHLAALAKPYSFPQRSCYGLPCSTASCGPAVTSCCCCSNLLRYCLYLPSRVRAQQLHHPTLAQVNFTVAAQKGPCNSDTWENTHGVNFHQKGRTGQEELLIDRPTSLSSTNLLFQPLEMSHVIEQQPCGFPCEALVCLCLLSFLPCLTLFLPLFLPLAALGLQLPQWNINP